VVAEQSVSQQSEQTEQSGPGRQRRQRLNRTRVVDGAIALADAGGLDAVVMRRLAKHLGVEAMSLYNHIANKDALLDGVLDRVAGEIELPEAGLDWRRHTRSRAVSAHAMLLRHPWAAGLWTSRISLGEARLRYLECALRTFREAGFSGVLLDRGFHAVENHILGHAMQAMGFPLDSEQMATEGESLLRVFPSDDYPDLAAHIRHHLDHPSAGDDDEFEFGLDLILDGLERMLAES
jgi:AcrR family transcriptional regulator